MRKRAAQSPQSRLMGWMLLLMALAPASTWAAPVVSAADAYADAVRRLEVWIAAEVEAKGLPALSIALVDDQRLIWARGFGFVDPERRVAATADTVYRVGVPGTPYAIIYRS